MRKRSISEVLKINTTALAYMGDGVYELLIREYILSKGSVNVDKIHKDTVAFVNANSQCKVIKEIISDLTDDEETLVKRARNRKIVSKPKNVDTMTYKWATAFEALMGFLYLTGNKKRLEEIANKAIEIVMER